MPKKPKEKELSRNVLDYLLENGAVSAGISTRETLADSPPSADITYLMENGMSAITFATALNREGVRAYLSKEDRLAVNQPASYMGLDSVTLRDNVAALIEKEGHQALATEINLKYRTEVENWHNFIPPDISHRYLAVVSGAGSFGWSGSVGTKGYGTAIGLATVITDAKLEPTPPVPEEESFCADCRVCAAACPVEMFSASEKMTFTLGGREHSHAARIDLIRCAVSCGGQAGLHKSKKWSSWSPGRFEIPENREDLWGVFERAFAAREKWPPMKGEMTVVAKGKTKSANALEMKSTGTTCALCQMVCTGEKAENLENLRILRNSGCVIQYPDGSLKILTGEDAEKEFNSMPAEHRALYC